MADLVAAVLHDTPAKARKNVRMTSRKRNGLTRRAPGSPARAAEFKRPPEVDISSCPGAGSTGKLPPSPLTRRSVSAHLYSPAIPAPFGGNVIVALLGLAMAMTLLLLIVACG